MGFAKAWAVSHTAHLGSKVYLIYLNFSSREA
jgi:hypothetical protein